MKYAILNCNIYSGDNVLYNKAIIVNGNLIESLIDIDKVPNNLKILNLDGWNIAPGFIDLQINVVN